MDAFKSFDSSMAEHWDSPQSAEWRGVENSAELSSCRGSNDRMGREASPTNSRKSQNNDAFVEDFPPCVDTDSTGSTSKGGQDDAASASSLEVLEAGRDVFEKARQYLNPSCFFRWIIYLYAQRKMNVFFFIHFTSTMVIWAHFALIKFEQQMDAVPQEANWYWLKRLAPPLEFGSMHAILFQMALIPITMCRFSIAALGDSIVNRVVPLNRMLAMHIHLGYTMVLIVFVATVFFFFFFGFLCGQGEQAFCDKFTMEIMITGYVILGFLLTIGFSSFFRYNIPYEVFYYVHHLVFLLYIITILHTMDVEQRSGRSQRSQTFKWFTSTLLYYVCDRVAMKLNHHYDTKMVGSSVVWGSNGSKLVILKVQRPALFQFKPGQYAYIRISSIDNHWHPFSIASRPDSPYLEFYIEVFDTKKSTTWTKQLWYVLNCERGMDKCNAYNLSLQIMGPYGTSLAGNQNYSHALAIGAGTGVVPILSMFKEHMHSLFALDPNKYFRELESSERIARQVELAQDAKRGSLARKLLGCICRSSNRKKKSHDASSPRVSRRDSLTTFIRQSIVKHDELKSKEQMKMNMRDLKKSARKATRSIYGTVILSFLPVVGITLFAMMISWCTIPIEVYPGMVEILKMFTVVFQACFAITAIFFWNLDGILSYVDMIFVLASPFVDVYWARICDTHGRLEPGDLVLYSLFIFYMIIRLWVSAIAPAHSSWYRSGNAGLAGKFDKMTFVWTTRSASQVSEILPDILELWNLLVQKWGLQNARKVCEISIYVTDPDDDACALLRKEFGHTEFYRNGGMRRGRADMKKIIEDHTIGLINSRSNSHSLLTFCGSPSLGREIHYNKISNDMITAMTGNCQSHVMDYVSESYGGVKASPRQSRPEEEGYESEESMDLLTNRKTVIVDDYIYECVELVDSSMNTVWI